jgi:hypothetical protein
VTEDVESLDHGTTAQIEHVLAWATVAGAAALPMADMRQSVLDGYPLAQLGQEAFIGVDADAAAARTGGTARLHGAGGTRGSGEVDRAAGHKRQLHLGRTAPGLARPIQREGRLGKAVLGKWEPLCTGQAVQYSANASGRSRTQRLLK